MCNLFRSIALSQLVTFPTHLTSNGPRGCLDLVATNIPERLTSIESLSPLGASDHLIVLGRLSIAIDIAQSRESTSDTAPPRFSHHLLTQSQWEGVNAEIAATHWQGRSTRYDWYDHGRTTFRKVWSVRNVQNRNKKNQDPSMHMRIRL